VKAINQVTGSVGIPKVEEIYSKNLQELRQLKIREVFWNGNFTLGFKLSDG
jgi:hypothetical protein